MKKVCIAASRDVGFQCASWARENTPAGFELTEEMSAADIIICVMYEKILGPELIKKSTCFNFHPGILPEYKGSGTFSWVIINEEKKAGITLHLIDRGLDTGDVIEIREFLIGKEDTAYSLFLRGEDVIFKMFKNWYVDLLRGQYTAMPQRGDKGKLYYKKDLQKAKNLTRFVKAFYFPNKESAYYINDKAEKIYLNFKEEQ
jgi:methionyl-tRNA formyltransferase